MSVKLGRRTVGNVVFIEGNAGSSNGRTSPFGGEYLGSNPSPANCRVKCDMLKTGIALAILGASGLIFAFVIIADSIFGDFKIARGLWSLEVIMNPFMYLIAPVAFISGIFIILIQTLPRNVWWKKYIILLAAVGVCFAINATLTLRLPSLCMGFAQTKITNQVLSDVVETRSCFNPFWPASWWGSIKYFFGNSFNADIQQARRDFKDVRKHSISTDVFFGYLSTQSSTETIDGKITKQYPVLVTEDPDPLQRASTSATGTVIVSVSPDSDGPTYVRFLEIPRRFYSIYNPERNWYEIVSAEMVIPR